MADARKAETRQVIVGTKEENFLSDIRAEVLAADLLQGADAADGNAKTADLLFQSLGVFRRGYRPEVQELTIQQDKANQFLKMTFQVNRDGLYDYLPEGLFHKSRLPCISASMDVQNIEEADARTFFLPFEQTFYHLRLEMEQLERDYMQGYTGSQITSHFLRFWGMESHAELDRHSIITLLYLLPFASMFAGDFDRCADCFTAVLGLPVQITLSPPKTITVPSRFMPVLGQTALGVDFVLSESLNEEIHSLNIIVGPLPRTAILDFLPEGKGIKLVQILCDFLIPAGMMTTLNCSIAEEEGIFTLTEENHTARLDLTTFLN